MWTIGWVKATHLSHLDFNDPASRSIPFFKEARDYYMKRILSRPGVRADTEMSEAYGTCRLSRTLMSFWFPADTVLQPHHGKPVIRLPDEARRVLQQKTSR